MGVLIKFAIFCFLSFSQFNSEINHLVIDNTTRKQNLVSISNYLETFPSNSKSIPISDKFDSTIFEEFIIINQYQFSLPCFKKTVVFKYIIGIGSNHQVIKNPPPEC